MKILYLAVFILFVILVLYYFNRFTESLDDKVGTEADEIYTSGATMRILGQSFSSSNQDTSPRHYNVIIPGIDRPKNVYELHRAQLKELGTEHMVNEARAPEFWELNPILGKFKEEAMSY